MRAEQSIAPEQKDVYLLIQWKDRPDKTAPWWVHWFYDHIHVPYLRFVHKHFGIPRAKQATVTSDQQGRTITTYSWFENGGVFDDPDKADAACVDEFDGYRPVPYNRPAGKQSADYGAPIFPRSNKPQRWAKPTLSLIMKDRKQDEQEQRTWKECLRRLNQVLDQ